MTAIREYDTASTTQLATMAQPRFAGKRTGMVVFSHYPADPRPRRAAEALLSEGMQVELVCEADDKSPRREKHGAMEVTRVPIRHSRGGAFAYAYEYSVFILVSAAIFAWRSLRRRYDLIYVHNMPDILVLSALIPKMLGAKVILDEHDPMPELMQTIFNKDKNSFAVRVIRWMEEWSQARADLVITVNVACKRVFSERSCRADKIGVVMNSPDEAIFPYRAAGSYPVREADVPFVIMYHGSLVERNGLQLAVDALSLVRDKILLAELRIFGRMSHYLEEVLERARSLGLQDRVRYMGPRKLEELAAEIECCDLGVIPNQRNTFTDINTPTRIFEYLALGKPVVAPCTPGIRDYFAEDALIYFESGKAEDLAKSIEYAASDNCEAVDIAERGQQCYLAHTWQQERETLLGLVAGLIHA